MGFQGFPAYAPAYRLSRLGTIPAGFSMPVLEPDPWRVQYFERINAEFPNSPVIPTDDPDAYALFPEHRWIYNKMMVADSQGLANGPHGLAPAAFPVFSKPIYNMKGMGAGSRVFATAKDYGLGQQPGHMWMELLTGEHVSTDVAVLKGKAAWWRHAIGKPLADGMFDYWTVLAEPRADIEDYCGAWLTKNMAGYTGMVNFETIGARIIEVHLRFTDQWPDLYGAGWLKALIGLYSEGRWSHADTDRRDGYSVVLFGAHKVRYRHPDPGLVEDIRKRPGISSVQITFHEDKPASAHSMPPGGFRLAIVNCRDLAAGLKAREELALRFWSTNKLASQQPRISSPRLT
jgi:hypothetical protein